MKGKLIASTFKKNDYCKKIRNCNVQLLDDYDYAFLGISFRREKIDSFSHNKKRSNCITHNFISNAITYNCIFSLM